MFADFPAFSGLILFVSVLTAALVCLNARAIGTRLGVMANPDAFRKRHHAPTPQVGGIAILLALFMVLPVLGATLGVDLGGVSHAIAIATNVVIGAIVHLTGNG